MHDSHATPHAGKRAAGHVVGAVLGLTTLVTLLVAAFAWPAANTEPHDLPLALVGPDQATAPLAERLAAERPGAFEITTAGDRDGAIRLIEDREVYGAVVVAADGVEVLTASAASPAVEQLLSDLATRIGPEGVPPADVTDVVPTTREDPRGAGLSAGSLPIVLAGIATAAVLTLRIPQMGARLAGALGVAAAGGLAIAALLQPWLGSLEGNYWVNSGVLALGIAAIATTLIGLAGLLGPVGLASGAATLIALGNPLSGLTSAPELLPEGWGAFGQLLPPGALGTALRSVGFFDGAGSGSAFAVLSSWLAVGLLLCLTVAMRRGGRNEEGATPDAAARAV